MLLTFLDVVNESLTYGEMKRHMMSKEQQVESSKCRSLVVANTNRSLIDRHKERELRRAEADAHRYKTIWTKDPHDGEYRPVSRILIPSEDRSHCLLLLGRTHS